jgi:hypothetical protein
LADKSASVAARNHPNYFEELFGLRKPALRIVELKEPHRIDEGRHD